MMNMRPSWPPPSRPSVARGRITAVRAAESDATSKDIRQLHRRDLLAQLLAVFGELAFELGVRGGEQAHREEASVGRARLADGEGRDRDSLGHLHDGVERVLAGEVARADGHAKDPDRGLGSDHSW